MEDICCGVLPLKAQFPRIFALNLDKSCLVSNMLRLSDWLSAFQRPPKGGEEMLHNNALRDSVIHVILVDKQDSWMWLIDVSRGFTVVLTRSLIDTVILDTSAKPSR